jgi:competence protein ComEA
MKDFLPIALICLTVSPVVLRAQTALPDLPGKDVFEKVCTACHGVELVTVVTDTKDGWASTVADMVSKGAEVTPGDTDKIVNYLATAFPAPTNVNKATSKDLETNLELTTKEADAVVAYRKQNGDFKTIDDLKKVPGLPAAKIDAKKNRISFQ